MKQRKRPYAILALSLSLILFLSACSGDGGTSTATASPPADSAGGTEPSTSLPLEEVELSFYYPGGTEQADGALVEERINEILKEKINATLKMYPVDWGSWIQRINLMVAGNEPFDLMFMASYNNYSGRAATGNFLPLNDLIEEYGQDMLTTIDPVFLDGTLIDGITYAVPVQKEIAASHGLVFNMDMVDRYGFDLDLITELADIEPMLQTIKDNEPAIVVPFWGQANNTSFLDFEDIGAKQIPGAIRRDGSTTVINQFETDEPRELFQLMRDWNLKGFMQDDPTTQNIPTAHNEAGTLFAQYSSLKPGKDDEMSVGLSYSFKQVELLPPYIAAIGPQGAMTAISRTSQNPERAMMLINLLHTDQELLNLIVMGIPGIHYTEPVDNIISALPRTESYRPNINWMIGNQFLNYVWDTEDPQKFDLFREFNTNATVSPLLGFNYNAETVANEGAAIGNIYNEFIGALASGALDVEPTLVEFNNRLRSAGLERVIEEKQRQIDEFLSNQ